MEQDIRKLVIELGRRLKTFKGVDEVYIKVYMNDGIDIDYRSRLDKEKRNRKVGER